MKLIFLHGSPAVGKLTVAKALLRLVQGRLVDNHAAIDLARTIFDFGAPGFRGWCTLPAAPRSMPPARAMKRRDVSAIRTGSKGAS
jgi:hypothetical protein